MTNNLLRSINLTSIKYTNKIPTLSSVSSANNHPIKMSLGLQPTDFNAPRASTPTGALLDMYLEVNKASERLRMLTNLRNRGSGLPDVISIARKFQGNKKATKGNEQIDWKVVETLMNMKILDADKHLCQL